MIETDVIIVGSGIAGLTLAYLLERKGVKFVVLDRIQKQRQIALAETLPPAALPLLESLGLLDLFEITALRKTYGYHAVWGSDQLQSTHFFNHNPFKYGLKIDKQAILLKLKQGIEHSIIPCTSFDIAENSQKTVTVEIRNQENTTGIQGKIIVDASGRKRAVLQKLNIPSVHLDNLLSFTCHIPRVKIEDLVHDVYTESFEHGWGIVSGLDESSQVMTLFTNKEIALSSQLTDLENWAILLKETVHLKYFLPQEALTSIKGSEANSSIPKTYSGPNWIAIGDAAMAYDPLSSHGITNAIYTADFAVESIEQYINNVPNTLKVYHNDMSDIVDTYLIAKDHQYQSEHRWSTSPFWNIYASKVLQ